MPDGRRLDVAPFKGPLRVREAHARIAALDQIIDDRERRGHDLCDEFARQYPKAPAKLVRYHDRTLTYFRWRRSTARQWRDWTKNSPRRPLNATITFTTDVGLGILAKLPESASHDWLQYDRHRLALNLEIATAAYEKQRLADWIEATQAIADIEANGVAAVMRTRGL